MSVRQRQQFKNDLQVFQLEDELEKKNPQNSFKQFETHSFY